MLIRREGLEMTSSRFGTIVVAAVTMVPLILTWTAPAQGQSGDQSAAVFKAKCAVCHAPSGKGDSPAGKSLGATDLTKVAASKSAADLKAAIENGRTKCPPMGRA